MPGSTTDTEKHHAKPHNLHYLPQTSARSHNPYQIVVNRKTPESHSEDSDLVKLTEKLAREAKNGTLKGLGVIAEYEDGYTFGLEGSYLADPGAAILPIVRLKNSILQILQTKEAEEGG